MSPEIAVEGRWRHLVFVFQKAGILKNSSCSLYVNASLIATRKISYIPSNLTPSASNNNVASVSAMIGTPPCLHRISNTKWRQGPVHLVEEAMQSNTVSQLHQLGPTYLGSFQAPINIFDEPVPALCPEEKVVFGVYGVSCSTVTVSRIKKLYNQLDAKIIARQLHLSTKENTTPIRLLPNSASHLTGAARSLGAVMIGYQGVRSFNPRPIARVLECVGGTAVLLGLVAMASDVEGLYAAVKALCGAVKNNPIALRQMKAQRGYQLLGMLMKRKRHLLNNTILYLVFSLVGSLDCLHDRREVAPMWSAFEDLLIDIEIWRDADNDLLRSLLEHFYELIVKSPVGPLSPVSSTTSIPGSSNPSSQINPNSLSSGNNSSLSLDHRMVLLEKGLMSKLLCLLMKSALLPNTMETLKSLLQLLLMNVPRPDDLRKFGQFMVWTLPPKCINETHLNLEELISGSLPKQYSLESEPNSCSDAKHTNLRRLLRLRIFCFDILLHVLTNPHPVNLKVCEEIQKCLGFDWLTLFLQSHLHKSCIVHALHTLVVVISPPACMLKFRDGVLCSGWLKGSEAVLQRRHGIMLMQETSLETSISGLRDLNSEACHLPGFVVLQRLLAHQFSNPEAYFLMTALLLGNRVSQVPSCLSDNLPHSWMESVERSLNIKMTVHAVNAFSQFELDSLYNMLFRDGSIVDNKNTSSNINSSNKKSSFRHVEFCFEVTSVLLSMIRNLVSYLSCSHPVSSNDQASPSEDTEHTCPNIGASNPCKDYPVAIMQFFVYLYQSNPDFSSMAMSSEFLLSLASVLFPKKSISKSSSGFSLDSYSDDSVFKKSKSAECQSTSSNEKVKTLITHPVRKFVFDFFKMIIMDNFALPPSNRSVPLIDILLESRVDHSTLVQQREFQTCLLRSLADHFLAVDILCNSNLPLPAGGGMNHLTSNVLYFATRLVDKLVQGGYQGKSKDVIYFVNRLFIQSKKRHLSPEPLYRCLNRLVLFQLSQPIITISDQGEVVSFMQKMISVGTPSPSSIHLERVLTAQNSDPTFVPSLVHVLIQFATGTKVSSLSISSLAGSIRNTVDSEGDDIATEEGYKSISRAAGKVWEVVYALRRQSLEELVKLPLPPSGTASCPLLTSIIPILSDMCQKFWTQHQEFEQSGGSIGPHAASVWGRVSGLCGAHSGSVGSSIQAKISRMSSGMFRLASSSSSTAAHSTSSSVSSNTNLERSSSLKSGKKELINSNAKSSLSYSEAVKWREPHINVIKELVEHHYRQYVNKEQFMRRYLESEWQAIEQDLTRERGLWGPNVASPLDKWTLDSTEGPCRMRKRLLKNELFYQDYPYREIDLKSNSENCNRYKIAICKDSHLFYLTYRPTTLLADDSVNLTVPDTKQTQALDELIHPIEDGSIEEISVEHAQTLLQGSCSLHIEHSQEHDCPAESTDFFRPRESSLPLTSEGLDEEDSEEFPDLQVIGDIMEPGENIISSTNCGGCSGPAIMSNNNNSAGTANVEPDSNHQDSHASILQLLEPGERISYMYRCARILGLDAHEGLLLFGREHVYVIDGFTLIKTREIVDIDTLPSSVHEPIVPKSGPTSRCKKMYFKVANEDIREVHKRRYLLQPIAIEVFNADGRNFLLVFPKRMQHKVYSKFLQVAPLLTDNALESVSGQKQNVKMESASSGLLSNLIGEKSVTQRWERGEISNFQYLMYLNTLAGRSYNDLMQYPVFPWVVADYDSPELDFSHPATFRDLGKPMGAQNSDRLKQFQRRYQEWEDPSGETPPYHYGTHYSSAMIVASYLVRMEPFTQHFLKLQGGHFDLADRMFHSIRDAWYSAAKQNMADVKELIPEFFYLPDFLVNDNNFDLGTKQNGVELNNVILPTWAKGDPKEFIRAHREALESDYVSAHLHEWIDLIFGYKQRDEAAVDANNVFHHLFYEGNVDIYSIEDPLRRSAVIGYINNFGQIPKQLFRKPHPAKRIALPKSIDPIAFLNANRSLFYHHVDSLHPGMQPVKEVKGPVGHICQVDLNNKQVLAVEQNKCFMLPHYNRCLSWGFIDGSLRICNYESERPIRVFEMLDYDQILCCVAPCENLIVTAGVSTVVRAWQLRNSPHSNRVGNRGLNLRASLYGHTEAITCLAGSSAWNLLVSGSRDRSCIIWDLSRFAFLRQLSGHAAPVACLCINDANGDIASCSGSWLYLWSLNGEPIAKVNTAPTGKSKQILAVTVSTLMDWDSNNVILTGGSDGVVRMWSLEYVQTPVAKEDSSQSDVAAKDDPSNIDAKKVEVFHIGDEEEVVEDEENDDLGEQEEDDNDEEAENRAATYAQGSEVLQRSDDAYDTVDIGDDALKTSPKLSEKSQQQTVDDQDYVIISDKEVDSVRRETETLGETGSVKLPFQSTQEFPQLSIRRRSSLPLVSDKISSESEKIFSMSGSPALGKKLNYKYCNTLREGFRWERQLIFRSKLTMHTAYERPDNRSPSSVTALCISRDHRSVYVGDARGRVFSWSVPIEPGRSMADHWVRDEGAETCANCSTRFTVYERRHHCRNCGLVFCAKCSNYEIEIYRLRLFKPVRVCFYCYKSLKQEQSSKIECPSLIDSGPASFPTK